jgi:hypothetical protein
MEGEGKEGHVCQAVVVVVFRRRPQWQKSWLIQASHRGRGAPQDITIACQIEAISRGSVHITCHCCQTTCLFCTYGRALWSTAATDKNSTKYDVLVIRMRVSWQTIGLFYCSQYFVLP